MRAPPLGLHRNLRPGDPLLSAVHLRGAGVLIPRLDVTSKGPERPRRICSSLKSLSTRGEKNETCCRGADLSASRCGLKVCQLHHHHLHHLHLLHLHLHLLRPPLQHLLILSPCLHLPGWTSSLHQNPALHQPANGGRSSGGWGCGGGVGASFLSFILLFPVPL